MDEFLKCVHENSKIVETYKTKKYVSFQQLEELGYIKKDIFAYINQAQEEWLLDVNSNIYAEQRVALSAKGRFYVENII